MYCLGGLGEGGETAGYAIIAYEAVGVAWGGQEGRYWVVEAVGRAKAVVEEQSGASGAIGGSVVFVEDTARGDGEVGHCER